MASSALITGTSKGMGMATAGEIAWAIANGDTLKNGNPVNPSCRPHPPREHGAAAPEAACSGAHKNSR